MEVKYIFACQKLKIDTASSPSVGSLIPYKCDLSNPDEIQKMFAWIHANHGGVDVMINNAGTSVMKPLLGSKNMVDIMQCWLALEHLRPKNEH